MTGMIARAAAVCLSVDDGIALNCITLDVFHIPCTSV